MTPEELFLIVALTSTITVAGNTPIIYHLKKELCKDIIDLKVRLGLVEKEHEKED